MRLTKLSAASAICYALWGCLHLQAAYAVYHVGGGADGTWCVAIFHHGIRELVGRFKSKAEAEAYSECQQQGVGVAKPHALARDRRHGRRKALIDHGKTQTVGDEQKNTVRLDGLNGERRVAKKTIDTS